MSQPLWEIARERFACPVCFAKKGEPCIYLGPGRRVSEAERRHAFARLLRLIEQEGKPMPRGHYARENKASHWLDRQRRAERDRARREQAEASVPPWLWAIREFDAREVEQMRQWLRENWRLFLLRRL